jgi:MFS family permease
MFGSLFFVGVVISSLFMPRLSDLYGRKNIALSGTIMHVCCSLVILVSTSLKLSLFMTFLLGFAMGGRVLVGYCWMSEHMREIDLPKVTGFMFFCDSFGILISTIYFKYISKNWKYMFAAPQIFLVVGIIMLIKYRTDSPKYFYSKKDFARLRWSLTLIGRNNGVLTKDESFTKVFQIEIDMQNQYKGGMPIQNGKSEDEASLKSFFADPLNRSNAIIFMIMGVACNFIYYLINFYVKYLPGDLYTI